MKVIKISEVPSEEATSDLFKGKVMRQPLINSEMSGQFRANLVSFNPGARNVFHSHTNDQVLYVTDGKGIVATKEEEQAVMSGMMIFIPAGELHWHGAAPDSSFAHIAFSIPGVKTTF